MENNKPIKILNRLLEINTDRALIYSLVKNEIKYKDLKVTLDACIKSSLLCRAELEEEIDRIASKVSYEADPNQDFFNVWLVINECLSKHKYRKINSLFNASENVLETTYTKALNKDNLKYLSSRHKRLILKQKKLLNTC